ncbi:MAG TPA: SIS domain-containing protein [Limnochordales bacterium]
MTHTEREIVSQPDLWEKALEQSRDVAAWLKGRTGAGIALVGAGSSYYVGIAAARYFEALGIARARAVPASEYTPRDGELAILISRSGTTTEVLEALGAAKRGGSVTVALTGEPDSPLAQAADELISLAYVREESVVQTGSATTAMLLLRAAADRLAGGAPPEYLPSELRRSLAEDVAPLTEHEHVVVLGSGWRFGVACEAALKLQEMAQLWTERYVPLEYRHGPLSCAGPRTHVEILDPAEGRIVALAADIERTGARVHVPGTDPLVALVRLQRVALKTALHRGLDPDRPRHLTRSVVLAGPPPAA